MTDSTRRHLMAVMFTDVVGYTALMQDDEIAARAQRARHRSVLEETVAAHGGDLLQYFGDGSLSIFPSAVNAVRAAVRIQSDARTAPVLPLRVGIHQGEVSFDSQGAYGDSVNIAARIEALGSPGSVLISGKVHDDVKNQPSMSTVPLGRFELKNVRGPVEVYAVSGPGLRVPTHDELQGAKGGHLLDPATQQQAGPTETGAGSGHSPVRRTRTRRTLATLAVAVAVVSMLYWGKRLRPLQLFPLAVFDITPAAGRGLLPNVAGVDLALSPDGRRIVYVGEAGGGTQLWRRDLDDLLPEPIPGTADARDPVFSPDGASIAFRDGEALRSIGFDGSAPLTLVGRGLSGGADWGADGFLVYPSAGILYRIPEHGGPPEAVSPPTDGVQRFPQALSDGRGVLFTIESPGTPERGRIVLARPGEDSVRTLLTGTRGRLLESGTLLYSTAAGALRATNLHPRSLQPIGPGVDVLGPTVLREGPASKFALSATGSLLYRTGLVDPITMQFVWVARDGTASLIDPTWTFHPDTDNRGWDLAPDGRRILMKAVTDLGQDIWIKTLPRGAFARFTYDPGEERMPRWSPDGRTVAYLADRDGNLDVWSREVDGEGDATKLIDMEQSIAEVAWSPDGRWLIVRTAGASGIVGNRDLFGFQLGVDTVPRQLVTSPSDEAAPAVSPNGRWLAYHSDETGRREVFVRPFPNVEAGKFQISDGGGRAPIWSGDGRALYYVSDEGGTNVGTRRLMEATVDDGPPFTVLDRRPLFGIEDAFYFANNSTSYRLDPTRNRFLMARYTGEGARVELVLMQHFTDEVARLLSR